MEKKEAMKILKYFYDNSVQSSIRTALDTVIPEIKVSEDERMKNAAIRACKYMIDNFENSTKDYEEAIAWIEKQDEQKPVDKVEPKFKVGDWIVRNDDSSINIDYSICKITNVENGNYTIESIYGYKGYNAFEIFEKNFHIWTIQDAKDGDVLYSPEGKGVEAISIVRGWKKVDGIRTLCASLVFRVKDNEFIEGGIGAIWWEGVIDHFFPATKEQRDLLFQKMKEEGYEWDAEKKELKKIEQKSIQSEEELTDFEALMLHIGQSFFGEYAGLNPNDIKIVKEQANLLIDLIEQKFAWGEEDECCMETILCAVQGKFVTDGALNQATDWLKSLKERVQPQPKQEWSEEDIKAFNRISEILVDASEVKNWWKEYRLIEREEMIRLTDFLKSLHPQPHWEPSLEQIDALKEAVYQLDGTEYSNGIDSLYNDLKKL